MSTENSVASVDPGPLSVGFVGRRDALTELAKMTADAAPSVFYLHGIPGIGKTSLIQTFMVQLDADKLTVLSLDGEAIEPTAESFLAALAQSAACGKWTLGNGPDTGVKPGIRTLIVIDNYESLLLLDDWLREQFLPSLPGNMRVLLISRLPPNMGWKVFATRKNCLEIYELLPLETGEVADILAHLPLSPFQSDRVASVAQGHPLTLVLAVAALQNASNAVSLKDELAKILHELTHYFLKGIANGNLRQAIELAAVTRRVDEPMLRHIYPRSDAGKIYDDLARLPFMEQRADGLKLHQVIAGAVLGTMDARDPDALADLRRSIWRYLQRRDLNSGQAPNWRSTVDMIYQIHNPVVREAFFPSGARPRIVEAGRPEDFPKVRDIAEQHDGPDMANIVSLWWQHLPQAFRIVRDEANQVVGFCFAADDRTVPHLLRRNDPLLDAWMGHAEGETNGRERSLFVRRWLSSDVGEAPGPDQGASWIDLKRSYLEMRPDLRRVYVCAHDPAPYGPALTELQFQVLGQLSVMGTNNPPTTAMLDFGTGSVDGWLSRLLAGEVDAHGDLPFDFIRREIITPDTPRKAMTRREFEVVRYLVERRGTVLTRDMLLDDVWRQRHHGGSNVVDVVIRSLRRKLGAQSALIETVRGAGYRID